MKPGIRLSTSFFSYALEWNSRQYTLEELMKKNKQVARGPGIEFVGFQSFRGFPFLSSIEIGAIRSLMEKYEYEPACLDSNTDIAIRRDRLLTIDEVVTYLSPQILVAGRLGFPVLRVQMTTPLEALVKLIPLAEKTDVKLGVELHTPYMVDHPGVLKLRALVEEMDNPYLGFIPDFGTSMRAIPEALLTSFKEVGVKDEWIALTNAIWYKDIPTPMKFAELNERIKTLGANDAQIGRLNVAFSMNGRQPVEKWKEIIPRTVHVHGKFYGFDPAGNEPSIDYAALLKVFHDGGYQGHVSSEYEGSAFTDRFSTVDMIQKHHALCSGILDALNTTCHVSELKKETNY